MFFLRLLVATFTCLYAVSAWSWGGLGHSVICDQAWQQLAPTAKKVVLAAARAKGYKTFAQACNWPDHARKDKAYSFLAPLHYINVPRTSTSVSIDKVCVKSGCLVAALDELERQLPPRWNVNKLDMSEVIRLRFGNREQSLTLAEAYLLWAHLLADLYQPLHVSYADDRGGNDARVVFLAEGSQNLHRVWDELLVGEGQPRSWRSFSKKLSASESANKRFFVFGSISQQANNSLAITRRIYKDLPTVIDQSYIEEFQPLANSLLIEAGHRISFTLNAWAEVKSLPSQ